DDVQVIVEHVNLGRVRSFRACNPSYAYQASGRPVPTVLANIWLSGQDDSALRVMRPSFETRGRLNHVLLPELPEELISATALWTWDYLRRSRAQGFILALSGGSDSAACATIVRWMCDKVCASGNLNSWISKITKLNEDDPAF